MDSKKYLLILEIIKHPCRSFQNHRLICSSLVLLGRKMLFGIFLSGKMYTYSLILLKEIMMLCTFKRNDSAK